MLQLAAGVVLSSWPAQAGHPRLSFDANSKVVDGGAKPRHDDEATPRTPRFTYYAASPIRNAPITREIALERMQSPVRQVELARLRRLIEPSQHARDFVSGCGFSSRRSSCGACNTSFRWSRTHAGAHLIVIPANSGDPGRPHVCRYTWVPACAGMTGESTVEWVGHTEVWYSRPLSGAAAEARAAMHRGTTVLPTRSRRDRRRTGRG